VKLNQEVSKQIGVCSHCRDIIHTIIGKKYLRKRKRPFKAKLRKLFHIKRHVDNLPIGVPRMTKEMTDRAISLKEAGCNLRTIAEILTKEGHPVSFVTVGRALPKNPKKICDDDVSHKM
jgi:hypothetical protein